LAAGKKKVDKCRGISAKVLFLQHASPKKKGGKKIRLSGGQRGKDVHLVPGTILLSQALKGEKEQSQLRRREKFSRESTREAFSKSRIQGRAPHL